MTEKEETNKQEWLSGINTFIRWRDLSEHGINARELGKLIEEEKVEKVGRGLYWPANGVITEHHTIAAVCAMAPQAIVCLLSALSIHELGTQMPRAVWIAIDHKARPPKIKEFPIHIVRFSGAARSYGVEDIDIEGVITRVTTPARTVVDCFRFRRLVGKEAAIEALREALRERKATVDELWRTAEVCRAKSLLAPYLEAIAV